MLVVSQAVYCSIQVLCRADGPFLCVKSFVQATKGKILGGKWIGGERTWLPAKNYDLPKSVRWQISSSSSATCQPSHSSSITDIQTWISAIELSIQNSWLIPSEPQEKSILRLISSLSSGATRSLLENIHPPCRRGTNIHCVWLCYFLVMTWAENLSEYAVKQTHYFLLKGKNAFTLGRRASHAHLLAQLLTLDYQEK